MPSSVALVCLPLTYHFMIKEYNYASEKICCLHDVVHSGIRLAALAREEIAAQAAQAASKIDAMLVIDVSNSMDTSDKDKIGNEAMKMFIDMLSSSGDKVGIVAYTDKIEREKALLEIRSQADKEDLKQFIDQLNRGPYTDIAVGVKEAVKVLQQGADPAHEPMIVLLADGNNYLNKNGGRTQAESDQELSAAVEDAKQKASRSTRSG